MDLDTHPPIIIRYWIPIAASLSEGLGWYFGVTRVDESEPSELTERQQLGNRIESGLCCLIQLNGCMWVRTRGDCVKQGLPKR